MAFLFAIFVWLGSGSPLWANGLVSGDWVTSTSGKYNLEYVFGETPVKEGPADLTIRVLSPDLKPVSGVDTLSAKLWMPSMGHGSRPVKTMATDKMAEYKIVGAYFIMPGRWDVQVKVVFNDRTIEQFVIPVEVQKK